MRLVGFDTETTGLKPWGELQEDGTYGQDQVIQYTLQIWDDGVRSAPLTQYLHPHVPVPPKARKINGYSEDIWQNAPGARFPDHRDPINLAILHDAIMLGSYPEFDLRFCGALCRQVGVFPPKPDRLINLNSLGMQLKALGVVRSASLQSLVAYFGIDASGAHSSEGDVRMAFDVWERFLDLNLRAIGL